MKKLLLSSVVASSILATAGLARIATDGTGQFLVAPAFYAKSGFETNLKLVNTNLQSSVIMRAVVRDYVGSNELDFIITLSPSDVWEARIYRGADGKVYIQSSDDSNYLDALKTPVELTGWGALERSFTNGYVEFYPMAQWNEPNQDKVAKRIDPAKPTADTLDYRVNQLTTTGGSINGAVVVDNNSIGGYVTLIKPEWKASMVLPMMAFEEVNVVTPAVQPLNAASQNTIPTNYIDPNIVYNDLNVNTVTFPYSESGTRDALYFTFWGDFFGSASGHYTAKSVTDTTKCLQSRGFYSTSRDMEENKIVSQPGAISGSQAPSNQLNVLCEQAGLSASALKPNFEKGIIQLSGFAQTNTVAVSSASTSHQGGGTITNPEQPRFIATHMTATMIDGSPSYSWVYPFINYR